MLKKFIQCIDIFVRTSAGKKRKKSQPPDDKGNSSTVKKVLDCHDVSNPERFTTLSQKMLKSWFIQSVEQCEPMDVSQVVQSSQDSGIAGFNSQISDSLDVDFDDPNVITSTQNEPT